MPHYGRLVPHSGLTRFFVSWHLLRNLKFCVIEFFVCNYVGHNCFSFVGEVTLMNSKGFKVIEHVFKWHPEQGIRCQSVSTSKLFFSIFIPQIASSTPVAFPLRSTIILAWWISKKCYNIGPSVFKFDNFYVENNIWMPILDSFVVDCEPSFSFFVKELSFFWQLWSSTSNYPSFLAGFMKLLIELVEAFVIQISTSFDICSVMLNPISSCRTSS